MKKNYYVENLSCSHCSAKIREKIESLDCVKKCNINLYNKKMEIDLEEGIDLELFFNEINDIAKKIEKDVKFIKQEKIKVQPFNKREKTLKKEKRIFKIINFEKVSLFLGVFFFVISFFISNDFIKFFILIMGYIISGYDILYKSILNLKNKNFLDENFLMSIATIGALILGEYREAVGVMIFYKIGELFQDKAVNNSRKSIETLLEMKASYANLKLIDGSIKEIRPEELRINDIIIIKPGEKVPVDAIIINGSSLINNSALTGESIPISVEKNSEILGGSINIDGKLEVCVMKKYKDSAMNKIIEMVQNAMDKKADSEKFITKFAKYYTPVVVIIALIIGLFVPTLFGDFSLWFGRALIFLVISCPCALVLSVPLTFFSSIGLASKRGILVKGGNYLEKLNKVDTIIFDKTGTLTKGKFKIISINVEKGYTEEEVLEIAKAGEFYSNHLIGKTILEYKDLEIQEKNIKNYKEISGKGISANYKGKNILVGNIKLMNDNEILINSNFKEDFTMVYVVLDEKIIGSIYLADEIKDNSKETIKKLKEMKIETYMLTGDSKNIGFEMGTELGFNENNIFANLLPEGKVKILEKIKKNSKVTAVVGDGINDAPILSYADIAVAMGGVGSDIAIEMADIVISNDNIYSVVEMLKIASKNKKIVYQNIYFSLFIKLIVMILSILGIVNMWIAIFADVGVSIIAILNASKMLKYKNL